MRVNFDEDRTLIDEMHRENRITEVEYNTLRGCIDEAENENKTLLWLVLDNIGEMEYMAKNTRRALRSIE